MLSAVFVFPVFVVVHQEDNFELLLPEWRFQLSYCLVESLLPVETISSLAETSSFVFWSTSFVGKTVCLWPAEIVVVSI